MLYKIIYYAAGYEMCFKKKIVMENISGAGDLTSNPPSVCVSEEIKIKNTYTTEKTKIDFF